MEPIENWKEIINSESNEQKVKVRLEEIYRNNSPFIAEIIMNSHCSGNCLHCIYAHDYSLYNRNISLEKWKDALNNIYKKLSMSQFIFSGRTLTKECIQALRFLKEEFEDTKTGLITDGISVEPFIGELIASPPDWVDVSVDGIEKDHDRQRHFVGAYRKTINALIHLMESGAFKKINILTCLTTLNIESVIKMIKDLNAKGFKNFFITPVSIMEGYRPDPDLQVKEEAFIHWLDELMATTKSLSDSWIEVDLYDARYFSAIKKMSPGLFHSFVMKNYYLEAVKIYKKNEIHLCYFPASIAGIRELTVNSDGNILPPKVMAMGGIPQDFVMGNVLEQLQDWSFPDNAHGKRAFSKFLEELMEEKRLLNPLN